MPAEFPRRRADGSFSVEVAMRSSHAMERGELLGWLARWSEANAVWTREWRALDEVVKTDVLRWDDAYSAAPRIVTLSSELLVVRLDVTSAAPCWKDWMVKLTMDLMESHPHLSYEKTVQVD